MEGIKIENKSIMGLPKYKAFWKNLRTKYISSILGLAAVSVIG